MNQATHLQAAFVRLAPNRLFVSSFVWFNDRLSIFKYLFARERQYAIFARAQNNKQSFGAEMLSFLH